MCSYQPVVKIVIHLIVSMLSVNLWTSALMRTGSMFLYCSWLNSMSTFGMILWNNARKKQKASSSSILTKPPASLTVAGSKFPESLMVWKHLKRSSLCSYTVLTARLWKFHRVGEALGSLCATTWSSTVVHLGGPEKKAENPARSEGRDSGDVWCCLLHDEVQLMCIAVSVVSIFVGIHYLTLHSAVGSPHHTGKLGRQVWPFGSMVLSLSRSAVAMVLAVAFWMLMNSKNCSCMLLFAWM